jgi:putative tricarboxylic transport membrane protein
MRTIRRSLDRKGGRLFFCLALLLASCSLAIAQENYPARPIDFIVPYGPGGGADQAARKLAQLMAPELKVSLPVLNIPGASGNTGMAKLLTSAADGQSVIIMAGNAFAQFAMSPPAWKLDDIVILGTVTNEPSGFFVAQTSRWKTWSDLEKEAKSKPATLKLAGTGIGSADELTAGYLTSKGIKLVFVPFAKAGERFVAMLGGHADVMYEQAGDIKNYLENKQMRPILFFAPRRLANFKDVPVSKELGYEVTLPQYRVVAIKKGTDPAKVKVLSAALSKAAASPEFRAYLRDQWAEENSFMPSKESEAFVRDEIETIKKIVASMKK